MLLILCEPRANIDSHDSRNIELSCRNEVIIGSKALFRASHLPINIAKCNTASAVM